MSRKQRNSSKSVFTRRHRSLPLRESFLIFCEGETEVGYFSSFRKRAKFIPGGNALKIVENAISFKNAAEKQIDQYWVVFDKDETNDQDFEQAIQLAQKNSIHVAWSNQAFECWIILHYRSFRHACHRNDYKAMLKKYIPGYDVRDKGEDQGRKLYIWTASLLSTAIENAKAGHDSFLPVVPAAQRQTSTLVHTLIESILAHT